MSTLIKRRQFTIHDYYRMGKAGILLEDDRVELIYGEILSMSPIGNAHNAAVDRANRALVQTLGTRAIVRVQGSVQLDMYNEPQPDIVLLKPRDDFYAVGGPKPSDILLIIEMADSSLRFDRRVKARLYAEMGISDYWVADLNAVCVFCYSDRDDKSYRVVRQFQKEESVAPELLPEDRIPVASLLP